MLDVFLHLLRILSWGQGGGGASPGAITEARLKPWTMRKGRVWDLICGGQELRTFWVPVVGRWEAEKAGEIWWVLGHCAAVRDTGLDIRVPHGLVLYNAEWKVRSRDL